MNNRTAQRGLTLLELLVAMAVFTVVASIGYRGLQQTISAKQQLTRSSDQFGRLQRSMLWLERDLTSLVARPARDHLGDTQPAFYSRGNGTNLRVEFTHAGRSNPAGVAQSNLQRVRYHWTPQGVVRSYWPRLDVMAGSQPQTLRLFSEAKEISWFFLDQSSAWHGQWPPLNHAIDSDRLLPRAVRVRLKLPGYDLIERIFVTGAGA